MWQPSKPAPRIGVGDATPTTTTTPANNTPVIAAVAAGGTAALLVYALKGPLWGSVAAFAGVAAVTNWGINASGTSA